VAGRITELAAQTGALTVPADLLELVDVDDTSMAPTGTNKKLPFSELVAFLSAQGVGSVSAGAGLTKTGQTIDVVGDSTITVAADSLGVANNGVTNAKQALMPGMTIKGNNLGGNANPVDLNAPQVATVLAGFVARIFSLTFPTASNSIILSHNFGTRDVMVQIYRNSAPYDTVEMDVQRTNTSQVTINSSAGWAANEFRAVVFG
jgi:hypothetical protein